MTINFRETKPKLNDNSSIDKLLRKITVIYHPSIPYPRGEKDNFNVVYADFMHTKLVSSVSEDSQLLSLLK